MQQSKAITTAGLLITLGIVFGDIGTSPLYVFTAITGGSNFDPELIIGGMSCVLWTLLIIATYKYIYLALNADNKGEGGIFALYALLLNKKSRWIIFPALIGCASLISDGFLTPAISISSAVEGLDGIFPGIKTLPIVIVIIIGLFLFQQFGTQLIGKAFGPVMLLWFLLLGTLGFMQLIENPIALKAINPAYAVSFIFNYPGGIWVMGAVFLCTTGAEALYSDLGHFGKQNIRISWSFVLSMLLLNYFGQASFCLSLPPGAKVESIFFATVPADLLPYVIGIATLAAIIASQALITGIFTLVNEAIKLKLWTNLKVKHPTEERGQVYIPFINYFLMIGCICVVLIFRRSARMESAYGLAIVVDMLMTTLLFIFYSVYIKKKKVWYLVPGIILFGSLELIFLISNGNKIAHGGWFTLVIAFGIFVLLYLYYHAKMIRRKMAEYTQMSEVLPILMDVMDDKSLPFEATNLVYPARSNSVDSLDTTIAYSLFRMRPKRANVYWFVHIETINEPNGIAHKVTPLIDKRCFFVTIEFGFKEDHRIEPVLFEIQANLKAKKKIAGVSIFKSAKTNGISPDFKYVLLSSRISADYRMSFLDEMSIRFYRFIRVIGVNSADDFGLHNSKTVTEFIPILPSTLVDVNALEAELDPEED